MSEGHLIKPTNRPDSQTLMLFGLVSDMQVCMQLCIILQMHESSPLQSFCLCDPKQTHSSYANMREATIFTRRTMNSTIPGHCSGISHLRFREKESNDREDSEEELYAETSLRSVSH